MKIEHSKTCVKTFAIGSLFDGSGGFPLAASMCGGVPVWASEIEPYPIAVTRSRFPQMMHLGDISKINGAKIEPVDVITFGSPCQDMSVAGKRAGLKHADIGDEETTRSGLFMEAVRVAIEMRRATNGKYPKFMLWENVPGAFSSNKGEDFRIVLEELIKIVEPYAVMPSVPSGGWAYADCYVGDGWSLAYRVFDAQYWGVPQRRRRIHLILDLTSQRAGEILFEREGMRGYPETSRTSWQGVASDAERGTGAADCTGECVDRRESGGVGLTNRGYYTGDKSETLRAESHGAIPLVVDTVPYSAKCVGVLASSAENAEITDGKISPCLMARAGTGGNQLHLVAYSFDSLASNSMKSKNPHSGCRQVEIAKTLDTTDPNPCKNQGGIAIVCMATQQGGAEIRTDDKAPTVTAAAGMSGNNQPVVCYNGENITSPQNKANPVPGDPCHTLGTDSRNYLVYCLQGNGINRADTAGCNGKGVKENVSYTPNTIDRPAVAYAMQGFGDHEDCDVASGLKARDYKDATDLVVEGRQYIVRRLTPTECARLQGFPDDWGHPDRKESFSNDEYAFWMGVRNTHAAINGKQEKQYTREQMLKWYNGLHTDSAEYKMWGNGIALPPALYCMQGIAEVLSNEG